MLALAAAFKSLPSIVTSVITGKRKERQALTEMVDILREIWEQRVSDGRAQLLDIDPDDAGASTASLKAASGAAINDSDVNNLAVLHSLYRNLPDSERFRRVGIDVFQMHVASQSNMYAALSWTLIRLLTEDSSHLNSVRREIQSFLDQHGDAGLAQSDLLEDSMPNLIAIMHESLRLAQQSITLRKVMQPMQFYFSSDKPAINLDPGVYLSTLLSITNVSPEPADGGAPLDEFHPERYTMSSLRDDWYTRERTFLISTFGHALHACPGMRFAQHVFRVCSYPP
jgi:cytochrome P450